MKSRNSEPKTRNPKLETKQKSYPSKKTFIFRKVALYKYKE